MKRTYIKPMLYAEAFALAEHIAGGCAYVTNFGNTCPISEAGVVFFTNAENSCCNEDAINMMTFNDIDPATASVEDIIQKINPTCYNSFADFTALFTSA